MGLQHTDNSSYDSLHLIIPIVLIFFVETQLSRQGNDNVSVTYFDNRLIFEPSPASFTMTGDSLLMSLCSM